TTLWGGHPRTDEMTELKMLTVSLAAALSALNLRGTMSSAAPQSQQIIEVVSRILSATTYESRLQLILECLYTTIQPSRACLYWFDAQEHTCRLQEIYTGPTLKRNSAKATPMVEISLQDLGPFYQNTLQHSVVSIPDTHSMVNNQQAPIRLMNATKSKSWLSAGIKEGFKIVGVLAVEGNEPRLWSDADKQHLNLMTQLMSQGASGDLNGNVLRTDSQTVLDRLFAVLRETETQFDQWDKTLLNCLEQIGQQFAARWVAIISHSPEEGDFECRAQFFQRKKEPLPERLPLVSEVDSKMLKRMSDSITIQSTAQDLRMLTWRDHLDAIGLQSYLLHKIGPNQGFGTFLLLGVDLPRTWIQGDKDALEPISKTLHQALSRRDEWLENTFQQQAREILNQGLYAIQQSRPIDEVFAVAAQVLQQFLGVECLILLRWSLDHPDAQFAGLVNGPKFQVDSSAKLLWREDGFIQALLQQSADQSGTDASGMVTLRGTFPELTAHNSGWLSGVGCLELLGAPLNLYPEDPALGLVLALDSRRQDWSAFKREGVQLLVRELTSRYRSHYLTNQLSQRLETLECLNWYKQRHLEHLCRLWTDQMSKFQVLLSAQNPANGPGSGGIRGRQQQPLGQLYQAFSTLDDILKTEVWQLQLESETVSLAALLRRSIERIDDVVKARQLWTQVHNLTPSVSLQVPSHKLELMLIELLLAASYRSKVGDRIDIWCRSLQDQWLEISITDNGRLNPQLVSAIQESPRQPHLVSSVLESLPGLHFKVCQLLLEQMGGQLELAQLEDGRSLSRIILPLRNER
ncbi:MAG: ATP-binding protein, partial [Thermosynechococcaceae cyanobacterium]